MTRQVINSLHKPQHILVTSHEFVSGGICNEWQIIVGSGLLVKSCFKYKAEKSACQGLYRKRFKKFR